jgi:hypothetical protein
VASTTENCMNGIDDDGNGLVDCADKTCINAGYTCVPAVPTGFTGPGEVYDGPGASPTCDSLYPKDYLVGYATPQCDVSCSDCTCGDPTGVTCPPPVLLTGTLNTKCTASLAPRTTGCVAIDASLVTAVGASAGAASGGSCAASGGDANLSPITSNTGHLCAASAKGGLGCASGSVCWPKPQQPFMPQTCVFASGDLSCPTTGYPVKRSYYDSPKTNDTRACASTCDCATPSGTACDAKVNLYSSASTGTLKPCTGLVASYRDCQALPPGVAAIALTASTPSGGSCKPTGAATPTGTCPPTGNPTTACCTQ